MKFVRFKKGEGSAYGIVDGDKVKEISGSPLREYKETGETHALSSIKILAPIARPGKMLALALNYGSHLHGADRPQRPEPFYKTITSIIGPGDTIELPPDAGKVDMESELVVVIGKQAKNVSEDQALDYVFGYTCGNDVSAREWQSGATADKQWWRAKSADTFSPMGPFIATGLDPQKLKIKGRLNGKEGQSCDTSEMLFNVRQAIAFISKYATLEPGDMIWTGTSGSTPQLSSGDTVEIEIDGIGVLTNPVK